MTSTDPEPTPAPDPDDRPAPASPEDVSGGVPVDERDGAPAAPRRRGPNPLVLGAAVLLVVCAGVALWFGVSWLRAATDDSLDVARARDEVTRVGEQAVITFNTLDYRKVDESLDQWLNASTGKLREEVVNRRESSKQVIAQARTVTSAKVLGSSVLELNEREGRATLIAAIRAEVTAEGKEPAVKYQRLQAGLERTPEGWKLTGIDYVPFTPAG